MRLYQYNGAGVLLFRIDFSTLDWNQGPAGTYLAPWGGTHATPPAGRRRASWAVRAMSCSPCQICTQNTRGSGVVNGCVVARCLASNTVTAQRRTATAILCGVVARSRFRASLNPWRMRGNTKSIVPLGVANELRMLPKVRLGSERGGPALSPLCDGLQSLLVVERRCLDRHYRRRGVRTPCPPRLPPEPRSGGRSCSRRCSRRSEYGRAPADVRGGA